jgi:uncharacterized protein YqgV (UPF0045/DUF77 family)
MMANVFDLQQDGLSKSSSTLSFKEKRDRLLKI